MIVHHDNTMEPEGAGVQPLLATQRGRGHNGSSGRGSSRSGDRSCRSGEGEASSSRRRRLPPHLADDAVGSYDDASDTDRWASEKDDDEARTRMCAPRAELSDVEKWANEKDDGDAERDRQADAEIPEALCASSNDRAGSQGSGCVGPSRSTEARMAPVRRPNPWEHANRKTFKPIITIGKNDALGRNPMGRRRAGSLSHISGFPGFNRPTRDDRRFVVPAIASASDNVIRSAYRCSSLCIGAAVDVKEVYQHYQMQGHQCTAYKDGLNVVVHCLHHDDDEENDSHAFYFMYGSMVLWNFDARSEQTLIKEACERFSRGTLEEPEVDDFGYVYEANTADAKPYIHKDVIHLTTSDIMEKLAVAFGLAQSAKLGIFERITEHTIQNTRSIPEQLAQSGKISLSRKEISMRVGQLFVDRSSVNLHSDMLDTPDFFWEDDEWEPLYQRTAKYLEIEKRVNVLNHRLDIIKDLFDMLASEMHAKHATNLEVIVIVLILIEVIFQVLELMQSRFLEG